VAFVYFVVDNNLLSRVAWRVSPAIDHGTRPASPARPGRLHARNWGHSRSANQQKDRAYNRMTRSAVQAQMVSRQPRPDTPRSPCLLTCAGSSSTNRNSTTIIIIDLTYLHILESDEAFHMFGLPVADHRLLPVQLIRLPEFYAGCSGGSPEWSSKSFRFLKFTPSLLLHISELST
jgi:hypothetical protein